MVNKVIISHAPCPYGLQERKMITTLLFIVATCPWEAYSDTWRDQNESSEPEVISLLTLLPYFNVDPALNPSWNGGDNIQPVMDLAKDHINDNPSILENYTLELVHGKGGCNIVAETPLGFVQQAFTPAGTRFVGIIGPGCSTSTDLLGRITNESELSLVLLHGGGSVDLADRVDYPYLVGTLGSTENFVKGFINLLWTSQWKRVAILYDDSRLYYLSTKRLLLKRLPSDIGLGVSSPVSFTYFPLDVIQDGLLRITFILCPLELTQRIICLAKNRNMVYGNYQFVIMSHSLKNLVQPVSFIYNGMRYSCTEEDMTSALEMMLLLNYNLLPTENVPIVSNITYLDYIKYYEQYRDAYNQRARADTSKNSTYSIWATVYYDSVWAWALVLDNLTKSSIDFNINGGYGNLQSETIIEQFYRIAFQGMSGEIRYLNETGFTQRKVEIFQVVESEQSDVASIDASGRFIKTENSSIKIIPDSFLNETARPTRGLAIFFNVITTIQFLVIIVLHIITAVYYKRPSIKASSPKLLHISYVGTYITVLGTFTLSLHPAAVVSINSLHIFCQLLWTWCLPIGFTLTFCPVAVRTWRIYRIFKHYLNPGSMLSDPILIGAVLIVLLVDIVVAIIWTAADPFTTRPVVFVSKGDAEQISTVIVRQDCYCNYIVFWTGAIFSYKVVILFIVALFAVLTRKISNRSFATSCLRVLVFLLAIVLPLGFSTYYIIVFSNIDDIRANIGFGTLCIELNILIALNVVCVFVPPLLPLFKEYHHKVNFL